MNQIKGIFLSFCFLITGNSFIEAQTNQTVKDIDGNVYNTIVIGGQVWMKENLKTTKYNNGDDIGTTKCPDFDYDGETTPKYQWAYAGDESNVDIYGRLYTWYTVTDRRKICPTGWHVPTEDEWVSLFEYLGGALAANGKLKETGITHWTSPNADATNESGFTALPGGSHWSDVFVDLGNYGHFWTSTEAVKDTSFAWRRLVTFSGTPYQHRGTSYKKIGWSVRCLKD